MTLQFADLEEIALSEEKIIGEGVCKKCNEKIRWLVTANGKFMPIQMDDNEPHFPHCGKGSWTAEEWAHMLIETGLKILEKNSKPAVTNPSNLKDEDLYDGEKPPWE
jgi:hypothetical protein